MSILDNVGDKPDALIENNIHQAQQEYAKLLSRIQSCDDTAELCTAILAEIQDASLTSGLTQSLLKTIARKAGTTVTALLHDISEAKKVKAGKDDDHLNAARETVKSYGQDNLITTSSGTWHWRPERGAWTKLQYRELKQRIHLIAESRELTANVVASISELVKTETFIAGHRFNELADDSINCLNGRLVANDDGTWQKLPHRREDFCTVLIPVHFDPHAKAPRWEQFLQEIFVGAHDAADRVRVIKQAFGYSLIASCRLERFFLLIGSGANGKSVLLSVLAALVGYEQVCAVQPSQFENKFQRAHLDGKLVNIVTELAEGAEIHDAQLKALVSGELTTAEFKFQSAFDFRPVATHWFGTNHLPHTRDFSDALFRRAVLVEFPRAFAEHERDPYLTQKLLTELPGILNFALDGLGELLRDGGFIVPESSREMARHWRVEADQAAQFVEECCAEAPGAEIESSELFAEYREWARNAGISKMLNQKNFTTRLERLGFKKGRNAQRRLIYGMRIAVRQPFSDAR